MADRVGRGRVTAYDVADACFQATFPADVPSSRAYLPGAAVFGWAITKRMTSDWVEREDPDLLNEYRGGEIEAISLYREWGGALA